MENLLTTLNIKQILINRNKGVISVKVTNKLKQPYGIVHGGINATLAETAASLAGQKSLPPNKIAIGININTQHLKSVKEGKIIATALPLHKGHTIQTWEVNLTVKKDLVSKSIVTLLKQIKK